MLRLEPIPAERRVGGSRLGRVGDEQSVLLGHCAHARSSGEVVRILRAAVKHDQKTAGAIRALARHIELVCPASRGAGKVALEEQRPVRNRHRGAVLYRLPKKLAPTKLTQDPDDLAERTARARLLLGFGRWCPGG